MPSSHQEEWEELDKEIAGMYYLKTSDQEYIKSFIRSLLSTHTEAIIKIGEEYMNGDQIFYDKQKLKDRDAAKRALARIQAISDFITAIKQAQCN